MSNTHVNLLYATMVLILFQKLVLTLRDVNDNPPVFDQSLVKVSVPEGQFPPFAVAKDLFAYDVDTGVNGDVSYRIRHSEPEEDFFTVDQYSGLIQCNKELDREQNDNYLIQLEAVDAGTPRYVVAYFDTREIIMYCELHVK